MMSGLFGRSSGLSGGLSGGMKMAAVALLVQQLMKHSRSQGGTAADAPGAAPQDGGGIGDMLGGLLGGGGTAMAGGGLLGGLGGLLGGLRGQGMDQKVDSWVGTGPNQGVAPHELEKAFDPRDIDAAAQQAGTDRNGILDELSRLLPDFVDRATPQGRVPDSEGQLGGGGLGGLLGSLLGGSPGRDGPGR
jgi:uncharacterized protein YidB (DUF937 family)